MGKRISELATMPADILVDGDWFAVVDVSDDETRKISSANILDNHTTAFGRSLIDDANAAAFLTTLGVDTDILTLALPANVTISAFLSTILDDADAAAVFATLGIDPSDYLKHDGTVALSANWDVGTSLIKSAEIRSRIGPNTGLKLSNAGNSAFILIKDSSENVGINVANPFKVLDVYQSVGNVIGRFETGAANCFLEFRDNATTGSGEVKLGAIGDDMAIYSDGTSAIRTTTGGVFDVANSAAVLDEDDLSTDSATQVPTQQSVKAYVDGVTWQGNIDHGSIAGLGDNDHTQYILYSLADAENDFLVASGADTFVKKTLAETGAILEADINHDNLVGYEATEHFTEGSIDHGSIGGLGDDDHSVYPLVTNFEIDRATLVTNWTDLTDAGTTALHTHTLNSIDNPDGDKTFNMTTRQLEFLWTNPAGNPIELTVSGAYAGSVLHIHQHTGNPGTTHLLEFESEDSDVHHIISSGPDDTIHSFASQITGDADHRFVMFPSGKMEWADGTNPADTNLYRSAANTLRTDDDFVVGGGDITLNATALSEATLIDLTDAGATTLHKHDHGGQDGLGDDDHTQYLLVDGTRDMTGALTTADHGTATDPEVVSVVYGTGSPPAANTTPIGTIWVKYTA